MCFDQFISKYAASFNLSQNTTFYSNPKRYRQLAKEQGLLRTLKEKLTQTPVIEKYVENILFRWIKWDSGDEQASANCRMALDDIKKLRALGFGINFFYPKWAHGNHWQAYLLEEPPVPGGWKALAKLASDAHQLDCRVQCFIFENNASRMRYHEYLRRGYPIATGIIEGACRHLVKDRMERSGMRWSPGDAPRPRDSSVCRPLRLPRAENLHRTNDP